MSKITLEVHVPPRVLISTDKLVSLVGAHMVYAMLGTGEIVPGQKRSSGGERRKSFIPVSATDAQVAAAKDELTNAAGEFNKAIKGATK